MPWELRDQEYKAVLQLSPEDRYGYCLRHIADEERVWSLWQDGWALLGTDDGTEVVPIWPHSRYAEACTVEDFSGYQARAISLQDWLDRWIPGMVRDRRLVAVFLTPDGQGPVVTPHEIESDLRAELAQYE